MKTIPYAFLPPKVLDRIAPSFRGFARHLVRRMLTFDIQLKQAKLALKPDVYVASLLANDTFLFLLGIVFLTFPIVRGDFSPFAYLWVFVFIGFIFFLQLAYPQLVASRRVKEIERNLLPALRTMLVQVNAGVPLYEVLSYISRSNYGAISHEFKTAVREIKSGRPQVTVLEELSSRNPSPHFRRALGQIINGLKTGADVGIVLGEIIDSISREQIISIESYGGKLKPLAMFYMLAVAIVPALGITFLIAALSFLSASEFGNQIIFYGLLGFVAFLQIMFMGAIQSFRPNLLGD